MQFIHTSKTLLCFFCWFLRTAQALRPLQLDVLLNQESFVFSHNAATGYLEEKSPLEDISVGFSKNQVGTFTEQLECGTRAFDLRPAEVNGEIFFRHGSQLVTEVSFQDGLEEIRNWSKLASSQGEVVLLKIVSCREGESCNNLVGTILDDFGVTFIQDCSELETFTVRDAFESGPVLAVEGSCFVQNFDPTMNCHGFLPDNVPENVDAVRACVPDLSEADNSALLPAFQCMQGVLTIDKVSLFDCWADSDSKDFPITRLMDHLKEVAAAGPPQDGKPWQLEALWQVIDDVVTLAIFRPVPLPSTPLALQVSNILKDIEESEVNRLVLELVAELVQNDVVLNLVEVDNVCDPFGRQLLATLRPDEVVPGVTPTPMPTNTIAPTASPTAISTPAATATTPAPTPSGARNSAPFMMLFVSFVAFSTELFLFL